MDDVTPTDRPRAGRARSLRRVGVASCVTLTMALAAVACGDDGTPSGDDSSGSAPTAVERGEELARSRGCAGCHGQDFGGGAGPDWIGLAGSEVILTDGSTVVADRDYLVRAIANPSAELVEGYNLKMPANNLSDAEIDDIVAFIESLADG
jgi:cytochrome c oxidase subunit 2